MWWPVALWQTKRSASYPLSKRDLEESCLLHAKTKSLTKEMHSTSPISETKVILSPIYSYLRPKTKLKCPNYLLNLCPAVQEAASFATKTYGGLCSVHYSIKELLDWSMNWECWNSISLVNLGNIEIEQIEEIKLHSRQARTPTSTNERPRRTAIRDGPESYPSQKSKKISHKHAETW